MNEEDKVGFLPSICLECCNNEEDQIGVSLFGDAHFDSMPASHVILVEWEPNYRVRTPSLGIS